MDKLNRIINAPYFLFYGFCIIISEYKASLMNYLPLCLSLLIYSPKKEAASSIIWLTKTLDTEKSTQLN